MLNVVNKTQFYFQARWSKRDQIYFPTPNNQYPDKINETITPSNVVSERWERNEMCHIIVSVYCLENITEGRTQLSLRRGEGSGRLRGWGSQNSQCREQERRRRRRRESERERSGFLQCLHNTKWWACTWEIPEFRKRTTKNDEK